jgi:hypothetical protein
LIRGFKSWRRGNRGRSYREEDNPLGRRETNLNNEDRFLKSEKEKEENFFFLGGGGWKGCKAVVKRTRFCKMYKYVMKIGDQPL